MSKKASIGAGDVEITLDGETVILKPTLRAARTISAQSGGIGGAIEAVQKFDLDTMISVIVLGLNKSGKEANEIGEAVWSTGMIDLVVPVIEYLTILANGGRRPDGGSEDENPQTSE